MLKKKKKKCATDLILDAVIGDGTRANAGHVVAMFEVGSPLLDTLPNSAQSHWIPYHSHQGLGASQSRVQQLAVGQEGKVGHTSHCFCLLQRLGYMVALQKISCSNR